MKLKVPVEYFLIKNKKNLIIQPSEDDVATSLPTSYIAEWDDDRAVLLGSDKRWQGSSEMGNKVVVKWNANRWELYNVKGTNVKLIGFRNSVRPSGQYKSQDFSYVVVK